MGTNECSQPASKSSWDSQDFGDISMVLKWPIFPSPPSHDELNVNFMQLWFFVSIDFWSRLPRFFGEFIYAELTVVVS